MDKKLHTVLLDMTFAGPHYQPFSRTSSLLFTHIAIHKQKKQRWSFTILLNLHRLLACRYQLDD